MKLYLYIDGIIMPCAPSVAKVVVSGNSEYVLLQGGEHHVIPSEADPEALSLTFSIPAKRTDYENKDCSLSARELLDFIRVRASVPFELVLIGADDGDCLIYDVNMTAFADGINIGFNDMGNAVTLNAKKYVLSEAL